MFSNWLKKSTCSSCFWAENPSRRLGLKAMVSITRRSPDLCLRSKDCGKYKERLYLYSSMEDLQDLSVVTPLLVAMVRQLMNIPCPSLAGVSGTSRDRLML